MITGPEYDPKPMPGVRAYCSYKQIFHADGTTDLWVDRPTIGWFGGVKHKLVQIMERVPVSLARTSEVLQNEFETQKDR